MATSILISAIFGLCIGGLSMMVWSKRAAQLDARISLAIAHVIVPRKMKRAWRRAQDFKKNAGRKNIILVYKITGIIAVLLGIGLTIFLATI